MSGRSRPRLARGLLLGIGLGLGLGALLAPAAAADTLGLDEVLAAVDQRDPLLVQAAAREQAAAGALLEARGALDPTLGLSRSSLRTGSTREEGVAAGLSVDTGLGPGLAVGWSQSWSPDPAAGGLGGLGAASPGAVQLSAELPLLGELILPGARADILQAEAARTGAEALVAEARQVALGRAAERYWRWVAAGARLEVDLELLALAEDRQAAVVRKVELGALPEVEAIDGERVLAERRARVASGREALQQASATLALSLRAEDGRLLQPPAEALPGAGALQEVQRDLPAELEVLAALARTHRPALRELEARSRVAELATREARLELLPDLGAGGAWSRDLSGSGAGGDASAEVAVGISLEAPLGWRAPRGRLETARADQAAVAALARQALDSLDVGLAHLVASRQAALERARLAGEGATAAAEVARREARAFDLGASDQLRLNQREQALGEARKAEVQAWLTLRLVEAQLQTSTGTWGLNTSS